VLLLLLTSLIPLIWEDFKHREIHLAYLLVFISVSFLVSYRLNQLEYVLFNLLFLAFNLIIVYIYFSIKNKGITKFIDVKLGWGDIVFWLGLIFHFSFVNFIIFFIISLILILILNFKNRNSIPLAAWQSIFLIIILIIDFFLKFDRYNNILMIN